jgi:transcriptional regulator with XRE-family HTH domain
MDTALSLSHIGQRLQRLRRQHGLTLEQLAGDSGLSTSYLSQIENGSAVPSLTALQLIAAELGVDVAEFFPDNRRQGTRLIRAAERHVFRIEPGAGKEYAVLAGQVHDRAFSALYARHLPGAAGSESPFRHTDGASGTRTRACSSGTLRVKVAAGNAEPVGDSGRSATESGQ